MIRTGAPFANTPIAPRKPGGDADLRAVGDHRLLGFAAAVGVENIEIEIVLFEYAGLVADLGNEGFADAATADRNLEPVLLGLALGRTGWRSHPHHGGGEHYDGETRTQRVTRHAPSSLYVFFVP